LSPTPTQKRFVAECVLSGNETDRAPGYCQGIGRERGHLPLPDEAEKDLADVGRGKDGRKAIALLRAKRVTMR